MTRSLRYNLKEAIENIHPTRDQASVTDIVFQVGLNDSRNGWTANDLPEKYLEMQKRYREQFPKARQHITALPPLNTNCMEINQALQKLSASIDRITTLMAANDLIRESECIQVQDDMLEVYMAASTA